jgi:hypothetical protein
VIAFMLNSFLARGSVLAATLLLVAAYGQHGRADDAPAPDAPKPDSTAAAPQAAGTDQAQEKKPSRVFEGGVKGTAVPFEEGLARIGAASQSVQESCVQIMKESTRKDTVVMRGPNVLPGGIVIPAIGGQGGVMQFGEMPIRRDRLERYINDTEQSIVALQSYVDALIVPSQNTQAHETYARVRMDLQNAQDHLIRLKELASMKKLLNGRIGREALTIHDAMGAIDRSRAQLAQFLPAAAVTITEQDAK